MAQHDDREAKRLADRQRSLQRSHELRINSFIETAATSTEGREFLWWLLQLGKVGTQPFTTNALTTAFQCGELNVGNGILERLIAVNPAIYVQMQQEHQNEYEQTVLSPAGVEHSGQRDTASGGNPAGPGSYAVPGSGAWDHPDLE